MEKRDIPSLVKLIKHRKKVEKERPQKSEEARKNNIKKWSTFYRRNWNLYAAQRLQIRLHPFQHIMLYLIGVSNTWFAICSRGLSKSFIVALAALIKALLFPYSEIHITASTVNQAKKMIQQKMKDELCGKLSPVLKYMVENKLIEFKIGKEEILVDFENLNGSKIWVDVADEQSRGGRSTMTIYEECRLLKKTIIDSVFEKMAHPRQAKFLQNPKYQGDPRWIEECQSIYITSARYQNEWFYNTFKTVVTETYNNKSQKYNFFAGDIFLAILYGLKTKGDYFKSIKLSGELDTRMEDLNEMIGEAENPFFTRTMFHSNQIIKTPFVPPSIQDIMTNNIRWSTPKQDGEYRLLYIDYAFANSIANGENDNTVIGCMRGYLDKEKGVLLRGTDYVTTHESSDTNGTDRLIRELFWWYQCDYIVLDLRNGGETNYNHLTESWVHPELPQNLWNPHGFTVCEELDLQVVQNAKLEDLRKRTIDPQAIPCIIPIIGTDEFNSAMWLDLQKRLRNSDIGFLIDSTEFEENFDEYNYTEDERLKIRLPFVQTSLLVNEAVNLSQEWRSGKVRLTEPRTGTKDRIVALGYGNYIMTLLETKLLVQNNQGSDYNDDDWSFLAGDTSPSYGYYYPY